MSSTLPPCTCSSLYSSELRYSWYCSSINSGIKLKNCRWFQALISRKQDLNLVPCRLMSSSRVITKLLMCFIIQGIPKTILPWLTSSDDICGFLLVEMKIYSCVILYVESCCCFNCEKKKHKTINILSRNFPKCRLLPAPVIERNFRIPGIRFVLQLDAPLAQFQADCSGRLLCVSLCVCWCLVACLGCLCVSFVSAGVSCVPRRFT